MHSFYKYGKICGKEGPAKQGGYLIAQICGKDKKVLLQGGFMIYYFVLCVAVLFGIILCISYYEVHHFVLKRYQFVDTGIEETVKIIYISDLHGNRFGKKNERLVEAIRNEKPDCIIIGGDLIVGKGNRVITETALEFLKEIQDICLVIYSFGNHETRVREDERFLQYLREIKKMHIHLLNNELLTCRLKGTEFQFYG